MRTHVSSASDSRRSGAAGEREHALYSLAGSLERSVTHDAAEIEHLAQDARRSFDPAGLDRTRGLLARFIAGEETLDALGLYTQLERCTPLLLFHVIRRRGAMNRHRSGLQQSYGDHNRLLVVGIDRLARSDVEWYLGRCWQPQDVTADDIRRCCAAYARTDLDRAAQTALWLAACLHDYGKLVLRGHGLDAEDAIALAAPLLDHVCEPSLRRLVELGIRYHDLIEYVGTGETPAGLIAQEIGALEADQQQVARAMLGAIQLAGAASLGEGRVTARKVEIYLDCVSGTILADPSIESRLARLLAGDARVVSSAARARAAERLAALGSESRIALGELLERAVLRGWSPLRRSIHARGDEPEGAELLSAILTAVARCWQARPRQPLHVVFGDGTADWLSSVMRDLGTDPRALDRAIAARTGTLSLLNGALALVCGPGPQEAVHEAPPAVRAIAQAVPGDRHGPGPARARRLIVNADDYGLTAGVSAGIREAHQRGIVTTATAMMNQPLTVEELHTARVECPRLAMGVHLTLTAGRPLRPARSVRSLLDAEGRFPRIQDVPARLPHIDAGELRDEWRQQIETFLAVGAPLDHLDSHHHVSYTDGKLLDVMLALAEEYRAPLRNPLGPPSAPGLRGVTAPEVLATMARLGARLPARHPAGLIVSFMREGVTLEHLIDILKALPEGDVELMTHPGHLDDSLRAVSSYAEPRPRELALLLDPAVRRLIDEQGITLISFAEL